VPHALGFPAPGARYLSLFGPRAVPSR
jgi:hypothetical protein